MSIINWEREYFKNDVIYLPEVIKEDFDKSCEFFSDNTELSQGKIGFFLFGYPGTNTELQYFARFIYDQFRTTFNVNSARIVYLDDQITNVQATLENLLNESNEVILLAYGLNGVLEQPQHIKPLSNFLELIALNNSKGKSVIPIIFTDSANLDQIPQNLLNDIVTNYRVYFWDYPGVEFRKRSMENLISMHRNKIGRERYNGVDFDKFFSSIKEQSDSNFRDQFYKFCNSVNNEEIVEISTESLNEYFMCVSHSKEELDRYRYIARVLNAINMPEFQEIERRSWSEIGGYDLIKTMINSASKQAQESPKGTVMLLWGPPGTGKSYISSLCANILGFDNVKIEGTGEIVSPWMGESSINLRNKYLEARQKASNRRNQGCFLIIDDADTFFKSRTMERQTDVATETLNLINQGLTLMESTENRRVLTLICTNHPDRMDSAFISRYTYMVPVIVPTEDGYVNSVHVIYNSLKRIQEDEFECMIIEPRDQEQIFDRLGSICFERKVSLRNLQQEFESAIRIAKEAAMESSKGGSISIDYEELEINLLSTKTIEDLCFDEEKTLEDYERMTKGKFTDLKKSYNQIIELLKKEKESVGIDPVLEEEIENPLYLCEDPEEIISQLKGTPPKTKISLNEIVGLDKVKLILYSMVSQLEDMRVKSLFFDNWPLVILHGPQGCGKTSLIAAFEKEFPEIVTYEISLNKIFSARNPLESIQKHLNELRNFKTCLVFFDEGENLLMDRRQLTPIQANIIDTILVNTSGTKAKKQLVYLIFSTNSMPERFDPAIKDRTIAILNIQPPDVNSNIKLWRSKLLYFIDNIGVKIDEKNKNWDIELGELCKTLGILSTNKLTPRRITSMAHHFILNYDNDILNHQNDIINNVQTEILKWKGELERFQQSYQLDVYPTPNSKLREMSQDDSIRERIGINLDRKEIEKKFSDISGQKPYEPIEIKDLVGLDSEQIFLENLFDGINKGRIKQTIPTMNLIIGSEGFGKRSILNIIARTNGFSVYPIYQNILEIVLEGKYENDLFPLIEKKVLEFPNHLVIVFESHSVPRDITQAQTDEIVLRLNRFLSQLKQRPYFFQAFFLLDLEVYMRYFEGKINVDEIIYTNIKLNSEFFGYVLYHIVSYVLKNETRSAITETPMKYAYIADKIHKKWSDLRLRLTPSGLYNFIKPIVTEAVNKNNVENLQDIILEQVKSFRESRIDDLEERDNILKENIDIGKLHLKESLNKSVLGLGYTKSDFSFELSPKPNPNDNIIQFGDKIAFELKIISENETCNPVFQCIVRYYLIADSKGILIPLASSPLQEREIRFDSHSDLSKFKFQSEIIYPEHPLSKKQEEFLSVENLLTLFMRITISDNMLGEFQHEYNEYKIGAFLNQYAKREIHFNVE